MNKEDKKSQTLATSSKKRKDEQQHESGSSRPDKQQNHEQSPPTFNIQSVVSVLRKSPVKHFERMSNPINRRQANHFLHDVSYTLP